MSDIKDSPVVDKIEAIKKELDEVKDVMRENIGALTVLVLIHFCRVLFLLFSQTRWCSAVRS